MCFRCEVIRARLLTAAAVLVGISLETLAERFTAQFGAKYYVKDGVLMRSNNPVDVRIYG